jgi:hypothetical protein
MIIAPTITFDDFCSCVASLQALHPNFEVYHTSTRLSALNLKAIALFTQDSVQSSL